MTDRKLSALRALAERPGTTHEGEVARRKLREYEATLKTRGSGASTSFRSWKSGFSFTGSATNIEDIADLLEKLKRQMDDPFSFASERWTCACGASWPQGVKCSDTLRHDNIQNQIRVNFKRGERVYYNCHAYDLNCPGTVAAYIKPQRDNGAYPWAWLSVKFDHLKNARQCPIYSAQGWHLSHFPLPEDLARGLRGY